jgi:hypothetical protein
MRDALSDLESLSLSDLTSGGEFGTYTISLLSRMYSDGKLTWSQKSIASCRELELMFDQIFLPGHQLRVSTGKLTIPPPPVRTVGLERNDERPDLLASSL